MGNLWWAIALAVSASGRAASPTSTSVNLESVARDLVRGRANVTIVGDSINNFGQPDWMYAAYLHEWRPQRWRQIHVNPVSSSISTGSWVVQPPTLGTIIVHPGQSPTGLGDFTGSIPHSMRISQGPGWSGRAIAAGVHKDAFAFEGGLLRDADGTGRFLRSGHLERHRVMIVASDDSDTRRCWTIKCRNSRSGTAPVTVEPDVCFPAADQPNLVWHDVVINGSPEGLGHVADELHTGSDGPLQIGERVGFAGSVFTDMALDTGLGLTYVGQGGWQVGNHAHPSGSPEVPVINQFNPYPGSYSNQALIRHILAHETSHFMIWLGTNNGWVDLNEPERTVETMTVLLDRYRAAHAAARRVASNLPEPKFLLVTPYCSSDDCTYFRQYAQGLRDLAVGDTALIDLRALVESRYGDWSDWESELLVDGTHPTRAGSTAFARMLWREIVESAGPAADLDRDGDVDGIDLGLLLAAWGCDDPGFADLDEDGCVDGRDFGLMLAEWTTGG